jgi:predicted metal-dependent hydrolase
MKRLVITVNERGKISYVPTKVPIGRREPVTFQITSQRHSAIINTFANVNTVATLVPSTPVSFWPKADDSLSNRLAYVHQELLKIQEERRKERYQEFGRFAYYSKETDEEIEPYLALTTELYHDKDIELGPSMVPYHLQQRDLGSLNDRHPKNDVENEKARYRPRVCRTYSKWSE